MSAPTYEATKAAWNPRGLPASLSEQPDGPDSHRCMFKGQVLYYTVHRA